MKTVSKLMKPITLIMIYYWDKKVKNRLHVPEVDIITFKKTLIKCLYLNECWSSLWVILYKNNNKKRLQILKALTIKNFKKTL